jgi:hypothetical protein
MLHRLYQNESAISAREHTMQAPEYYEIRVEVHLDESWSTWFEGMTICHEESGETVIAGQLPDQTALHGVLMKIRDLGLPLGEVKRVDIDPNNNLPKGAENVTDNDTNH